MMRIQSNNGGQGKKVILLVADSLMTQSIDRGIRDNQLPAFRFLIEHGQYYPNLVSSFPTMSVSIDSSLLTGRYPDEHRVPGLTWYSAKEKKVINYGTGPIEVMRQGVGPVVADALIRLNGAHLNSKLPTIFEDLARLGYTSGSVNALIYRGKTEHRLTIPRWMQGFTSLPGKTKVKGPDFLSLGALSNPLEGRVKLPDGLTDRWGMSNRFSIETVKYLVQTKSLPDFLYVYLPDLDQKLHKNGPSDMEGVKKLDQQLQDLINTFGSPEKALDEAVIIVVGDSGMTPIVPAEQNPVIDLPAQLGNLRVLKPGEEISEETDIVLAVNETMAYVYPVAKRQSSRDIAKLIFSDPRIDFIAWKENGWIHVMQGKPVNHLQFKAGGSFVDPYQQKWSVKQQGSVLDLKMDAGKHTLTYGQYPDALKRLSAALHSHEGSFLVVTAKPGYELADRSSPTS